MRDYQLLDSGDAQKWERFGEYSVLRPCLSAVWRMSLKADPDAIFTRQEKWIFRRPPPKPWTVFHGGVEFQIGSTPFGHLGLFPEHADLWEGVRPLVREKSRILNLFAYSGGATLAAAQEGAEVCHLDSSKGMIDWARKNASLNHLEQAPIRWIVDDVMKFLKREKKRNSLYDGIFLDPPSFGRGSKGEVFKIERDVMPLLELCGEILSPNPLFVIFSCHTPGFSPLCMRHLLGQTMPRGKIEVGEMALHSPETLSIPSGSFAKWTP